MNILNSKNFAQSEGRIIIALPVEFKKSGFLYTQHKRGSKAVIYAQSAEGMQTYYEVWLIRVSKERKFPNGRIIPFKEARPGAESFGKFAWTCRSIERAMEKFNQLEGIYK